MLNETITDAAAKTPEKLAFKFLDKSLSYGELAKRSNQLTSALIAQGVKKGDRVGVFLTPSLESAVAIYGIMAAGAAYVPLDTNSPSGRVAQIINDCEIKHLIANNPEAEKTKILFDESIKLDSVIGCTNELPVRTISWRDVASLSLSEFAISVEEDDLAYVMYTSGTTGNPKGIMHTHRSGLAYARLSKKLYGITADDILGNHSALHFDISTMGYLTMPLAGATTVIIPEAYKIFPLNLSTLIEKECLTVWYSVPLALIQMLERGSLDSRKLDSLRWVLFGGEPFSVKHLRKLVKLLPGATFSNVYGPAEVNQCTFHNFSDMTGIDKSVPIGKAWDETEIILVDENEQEVATHQTGEILVRSSTMMKGYWNKPELTEKALFNRMRSDKTEGIFYRTGDLAKRSKNGLLKFLGRKDRQIKVRGYRIELDEIESILSSYPNVSEAAVFSIKENDGWSIFAKVVLTDDIDEAKTRLLEYLQSRLPPYIKLAGIDIADSLPRTSAGKVNHKKLERIAKNRIKT